MPRRAAAHAEHRGGLPQAALFCVNVLPRRATNLAARGPRLHPARSMPWIAASLVSAFFRRCDDLCTQHAVRDNAGLPVLFFSNVCSATIWLSPMALHSVAPTGLPAVLGVLAGIILTVVG